MYCVVYMRCFAIFFLNKLREYEGASSFKLLKTIVLDILAYIGIMAHRLQPFSI